MAGFTLSWLDIGAIVTVAFLIGGALVRYVNEKFDRIEREQKHYRGNVAQQFQVLTTKGDDKEARLIRVEMVVDSIKESQERNERNVHDGIARIEANMKEQFAQFAESIREIRVVKPRT